MENDRLELIDNEVETYSDNEFFEKENEEFTISEEAKKQSRKFFKFGSKPKKEKRKFESFEIVKTYTPKDETKKSNEFDKILEISNDFSTTEETISVSKENKNQKVKLKLRPQGKLVLICVSCIIILLSSLTIFNAVTINNLNRNIENLNNQITIQDLNIDKAIKNLDKLKVDATSNEQAIKLELEKTTNTTEVELYTRQEIQTSTKPTNWFDKLCNFISKIFGG